MKNLAPAILIILSIVVLVCSYMLITGRRYLYNLALWFVCRENKHYRALKKFLHQDRSLSEIVELAINDAKIVFSWELNENPPVREAIMDNNPLLKTLEKYGGVKNIGGGRTIGEDYHD